ncbi:hypothetical protein NRB16_08015 [Pseudomonas sp. LJDD11]|uniref:hypothetical protein n=1 Tax=unclassified Pseudomonas TaxID=196821 RepID=UPI002096EA33|nr:MULTISPECIES: hypothetical protein [unclassified Pseudomonas]MCO8161061.1 hypothetical protein [Pseudomonas sp. 21LCFQ010]MCQ9423465.1 hypothetical protein [Pseudomonas sp. LJDD11]
METPANLDRAPHRLEIVIVENDLKLLKRTTEMIAKLGWRPQPFSKPDRALTYIFERSQKIHTLIVDLTVPGRVSGCELALIVNAKAPEIRVIATSEILDATFQLSPETRLLTKPWTLDSLQELLKR